MRTRLIRSSSYPVPVGHHSVLLHEAIDLLEVQPGDTVVDATLGAAGHAKAIADRLGSAGTLIGFDLDSEAIARAREALVGVKCRVELIEGNFRNVRKELSERGIESIDKALFDLGWSGYQLAAGRGFSFNTDEPLLMTYAATPAPKALTARTIVNTWGEESLADIIFGWGEERFSRRIAKAIVERRAVRPFETARELAETIYASVPAVYRRGKLHPATKTFQALRIAVNDELGALENGLWGAWQMLTPDGRLAVISFHSIEDRLVKRNFAALEKEGTATRITKKPVPPSEEELQKNPRARSAKLRVIQKKS